ncbi:MAG: hypothetical protein QF918_10870, partial [Pirellulaceae bacterium]|nr:hypothetical protein [Pirellulaceae bacterium]
MADRQIQINPQAAKDQGLNEGDYVWVDANELDRPYIGWKDDKGPRHKAFRCMVRVKVNPGLPYNFTIMKTRLVAVISTLTASSAARRSCPNTKSGFSIWPVSVTTAPTPDVSDLARAMQFTSGPKTESCLSTKAVVVVIASVSKVAHTRSRCIGR